MDTYLILLDPHLTNSKLFKLLSEPYRVQVFGGITDLPDSITGWIVSKWQLVDGEATDIPHKYRSRLIVIDEQASMDTWRKCTTHKMGYVSNHGALLAKLRDVIIPVQDGLNEPQVTTPRSDPVAKQQPSPTRQVQVMHEPMKDPFAPIQQVAVVPETPKPMKVLHPNRGKEIICILQKKGGTGKTTVTETTARILAEEGKKVLVVELDPDGGHLARRLNLFEKSSINLLNHGYTINSVIERRTVRSVIIDYILSPDFSKREIILPNIVESLVQQTQEEYDFILFDCGTAWDDTILRAAQLSTQVWMISIPDHAALNDGRVLYTKLIQSDIPPERMVHVVNMASKAKGISVQEVHSHIPVAKLFLLPFDKKVEGFQRQKEEPLDCAFGKKLKSMVHEIITLDDDEEEIKDSWFSRIPGIGRLFRTS